METKCHHYKPNSTSKFIQDGLPTSFMSFKTVQWHLAIIHL